MRISCILHCHQEQQLLTPFTSTYLRGMTGGMLVVPADDAQLNKWIVLAIHGAFVGLADATWLKGLVGAYTNWVFAGFTFWEALVMSAAWGLFRFYNCIANLVSQWSNLHCSRLSFRCWIRSHALAGFVLVLSQYYASRISWYMTWLLAVLTGGTIHLLMINLLHHTDQFFVQYITRGITDTGSDCHCSLHQPSSLDHCRWCS